MIMMSSLERAQLNRFVKHANCADIQLVNGVVGQQQSVLYTVLPIIVVSERIHVPVDT